MHNFYLATQDHPRKRSIPILWASAKTYYEENSTKAHLWSWSDPWITLDYTTQEILQLCETSPPNVFGFSIYVWNEAYMDNLAKLVKAQHPDCVIVYGGPQVNVRFNPNFFTTYHWVDAVCPSDGYGEIIIKEILDHYPISDWESIPYVWYADDNQKVKLSSKPIEKRTFEWPKNIYKSQENHLAAYMEDTITTLLETTRGCPYKCIYCDWGGGTYTKLNSKPFDIILDEIEWVAANKIHHLVFMSANFGILPIDVAIAEHCVKMNQQYGFPKYVQFEAAKNNVKRVGQIQEIFVRAGMMNHVKVSVQALDDEIKNAIERIDPPLDQQMLNIKKLHAIQPNLPVKVETMMGLPGDSYSTILSQFDILYTHDLPMPRPNSWMLLPEAPAYAPEMRTKFGLDITTSQFVTVPWQFKSTAEKIEFGGVKFGGNLSGWEFQQPVETVVETYSYPRTKYVDMYCISAVALALEYLDIRCTLIPYLETHHGWKFSNTIDFLYQNFIRQPNAFDDKFLSTQFEKIYQAQKACVFGESPNNLIDFDQDFPFWLSTPNYIALVILTRIEKFIRPICQNLAEKFNDDRLLDLSHYISQSILDISYDPTLGRTFTCRYDWLGYFTRQKPLVENPVVYELDDKEVYLNTRFQGISWHQQPSHMQLLTQYTLQQITETNNKTSTTIRVRC